MAISKLKKTLKLWQDNNLISKEQNEQISEFMKERQKENFFRMLKWFSVIGALWVAFGVCLLVINMFELFDILEAIFGFFVKMLSAATAFFVNTVILPFIEMLSSFFGEKYINFLYGIISVTFFYLFFFFSRKKTVIKNPEILSGEQKYVLEAHFVLDMLSAICLTSAFLNFSYLTMNDTKDVSSLLFWNILGAATFIALAYAFKKNIYLIFGIYFITLSVGMLTGCGYASYFLIVTKPALQMLAGVLLILAGYFSQRHLGEKENFIIEKFISTYYWTGLLLTFLALWVASFWGFNFNEEHIVINEDLELWIANILFILSAIGAMYFGAKNEIKIFFNYGLTFLLIETYSVIFARIFTTLPIGFASLILGIALILSATILKKMYLNRKKAVGDVKTK